MSYWYLGSPYSKFPGGIVAAFEEVCRETGRLIREGIPVYSPIAHAHPVAINSGLDPYSYDIWLSADQCMMAAAKGLIILQMKSWEVSYGLQYEEKVFRSVGKPVVYMRPGELPSISS